RSFALVLIPLSLIWAPSLLILSIFLISPIFEWLFSWLMFPKGLNKEQTRLRGINTSLFFLWSKSQKGSLAPIVGFLVALGGVFVVQQFFSKTGTFDYTSASLIKSKILDGEWWRLLTAGVLHGGIMHILFNGLAVYSLGRLIASLCSLRMLVIVFLFSVLGGSLVSFLLATSDRPSVGASGGLLGCLGYLAVFSFRNRETIPSSFLSGIIQSICFIAVIGIVGIQFIDNGAHAGGLVSGALLGWILGPKQTDWWNYKMPTVLSVVAAISSMVLLGTFALAIYKMLVSSGF
ncbi:MAG: rhomboid family intramembrane serine protease, partial [Verrucomicrobiota bacterium]